MTEWQVLVAWTRTGEIIDTLARTDWSYTDSIYWPELGKGSVTVPLLGREGRRNRPLLKAMDREGSAMTVCIARDTRALWAGPIGTLGWDHKQITVPLQSIGRIFDARVVAADGYWSTPTAAAADLTYELGSRDLAIELLTRGSTGPRRDLPLVLPAKSGDEGSTTTYLAADLGMVYDRVKEISERDDGPDILIRAELYQGTDMLRWNVDVGAPSLGTAAGWRPTDPTPTWDWPVGISKWSGDTDGTEEVDTGFVPGQSRGSSSVRPIGVATRDRGPRKLALERVDRTTVSTSEQSPLDALAASYVGVHQAPTREWATEVHPEHAPRIGEHWQFGDAVALTTDGSHGWLDEPATYYRRVVAGTHTPRTFTLVTTDGAEVGMPERAA